MLFGLADGLGFGNLCVTHDLSHPPPADRVEVVHVVGHALDFQSVQLQSKAPQILSDVFRDLFGEAQPVFIHLLRCELGKNAAQIAFQVFLGHLDDLLRIPSEKSFDGVVAHRWIGAHLHVGDGLDVQRCPATGVGVVHFHQHRQQGHIHPPCCFQDRFDEGPTAIGDNPVALHPLIPLVAARTGDHQQLVGPADADHPAADQIQRHQDDEEGCHTSDHRLALIAVGGEEGRGRCLDLDASLIAHRVLQLVPFP